MNLLASTIDEQESPFEEIERQMMLMTREAFADAPVNVEAFFNDFDISELEELESKATKQVQVLFDFFGQTPVADEERKSSTERVIRDTIDFGFYVAYSAVKDDAGFGIRQVAYRTIYKIRKTFWRKKLVLTVRPGVTAEIPVKIASVVKEDNVPDLVIYRLTYTLDLPIQFR